MTVHQRPSTDTRALISWRGRTSANARAFTDGGRVTTGAAALHLRPGALKQVCKELGMSKAALARALGIAESTIYRLDRGDSSPSSRVIASLIALSGRAFDDLIEVVTDEDQRDTTEG